MQNGKIDRRKSQCYLDTGDDFLGSRGRRPNYGRRECARPIGDLMTRATCCCSVGTAWGPLCESCPVHGTDEYNVLCPGGNGFRPNGHTVKQLYHTISYFFTTHHFILNTGF